MPHDHPDRATVRDLYRHATVAQLREAATELADLAKPAPVPPLPDDAGQRAPLLEHLLMLERQRSQRLLALLAE